MRRIGAIALLMLMTACGGSGSDAGEGREGTPLAAPGDSHDTAATVTLAASGQGNCSARWEEQAATAQQVLDRSAAAVGQAIDQAGSVANLTGATMPALAVVAPASLPFACADTFLSAIRRAGVPSVLLSPEGGGEAALADFTLSDIGAPPPAVVLAVGRGGQLSWNGEALALDALPERLSRLSGGSTEIETPPGELELRPAREATFGEVHRVLRKVREGRFRAALLLPSIPPARPSARPPTPRPAPVLPPAGNAAAPRP